MVEHVRKTTGNQPVSQVRKHYYADWYVVIAPQRSQRPKRTLARVPLSQKNSLHHPIENVAPVYEIPGSQESSDWIVKVIPNGYPAFTADNEYARGTQEIVLETPRLDTPFHKLTVPEIKQVLHAYQHRAAALQREYSYVSIFKNQGEMAGATLDHTHSQIIATDIIPPEVEHDRNALTQYQYANQTSVLCDVIRHEITQNRRVVIPSRHTTTVCPYASQFPLEAWIIPHQQHYSIATLSEEEVYSVADHLKGVAIALAGNGIDFNYHLMEGVSDALNHFCIKIAPRITLWGGFELNTGVPINPVSPEFAARWYQQHIKPPYAV